MGVSIPTNHQIENNMIKINEYTKIAVSSLSKKLDDNDPGIRALAAFALGKIGSETAIPGLLKALEDSDEYVRRNAAFALANIGSETAIPELLKALEHSYEYVRSNAVEALAKIGWLRNSHSGVTQGFRTL